jgi:uncharacterized protein YdhG (YjbR/CyaY superfamily)
MLGAAYGCAIESVPLVPGPPMAKTNFQSVDDYIAAQPAEVRPVLERLRHVLKQAVPDAEECISYQIPAFRLNGRILLYFAGWKEHYSIYPASDAMIAAFKGELEAYRASKGTLRFPLAAPVPVKLIARIAKFRAQQMAERKAKR